MNLYANVLMELLLMKTGMNVYLQMSALKVCQLYTVWRESLAMGKFGEFIVKNISAEENLAISVHSQTKNYAAALECNF